MNESSKFTAAQEEVMRAEREIAELQRQQRGLSEALKEGVRCRKLAQKKLEDEEQIIET